MGSYVDEKTAREAHAGGIRLGATVPARDTKYSWWEVVLYKEQIIACVLCDGVVSCGEVIDSKQLGSYVADPADARRILAGL